MAKAKKSGGGKPAKAHGSKMSKELKAAVDKIGEIAKEPLAREILVAAAGAALAARKDARKAVKKAARDTGDAIGKSPATAAWLGAAVTAAAIEAGRRLLDAYDKNQGGKRAAQAPGKTPKAGKTKTRARTARQGSDG